MRINREGTPFILAPTALAAALGLLGFRKTAAASALAAAGVAYFFRDPDRQPPAPRDLVVSPPTVRSSCSNALSNPAG